jgi:hypothetical protein
MSPGTLGLYPAGVAAGRLVCDDGAVAEREETITRLLAVWNGERPLDDLDRLVTAGYRGHLGLRERSLDELKRDIAAYRARVPDVRFTVDHRIADGAYTASRIRAHATHPDTGAPAAVPGMNISRWEDGLLAEEWAVWETF